MTRKNRVQTKTYLFNGAKFPKRVANLVLARSIGQVPHKQPACVLDGLHSRHVSGRLCRLSLYLSLCLVIGDGAVPTAINGRLPNSHSLVGC